MGKGEMSQRRRLLFVCSRYLFPLDSGGKIRTVNILRGLKGGAFEITLASPLPANEPSLAPVETRDVCDRFLGWPDAARGALYQWNRMRHFLSQLPVAVASDGSAAGRRVVARALGDAPDVIVVDFPHAAVLAPPPYSCASVMFTHNVEAEIYYRHAKIAGSSARRAVWRNQAKKMERYERELLSRYTAVVAVADRDKDHFKRNYDIDNVSVIPTGVDLEYFAYRAEGDQGEGEGDDETVVFTGSMDWMANVDGIEYFMDEVWPLICLARPLARCVIVGRSPPPSLVERAKSRQLRWTFTGFVDDVRPFVHNAQVYIIPLRVGGGTRIKVYEAMAMGCPVVSTRIGVEGLPVIDGVHYVEADTASAMAAAIVSLFKDQGRRKQLSQQARTFVEANMSARRAAQVFEEICLRALKK
jgi:glycosyltransferase involved in cell wall biosynthesis